MLLRFKIRLQMVGIRMIQIRCDTLKVSQNSPSIRSIVKLFRNGMITRTTTTTSLVSGTSSGKKKFSLERMSLLVPSYQMTQAIQLLVLAPLVVVPVNNTTTTPMLIGPMEHICAINVQPSNTSSEQNHEQDQHRRNRQGGAVRGSLQSRQADGYGIPSLRSHASRQGVGREADGSGRRLSRYVPWYVYRASALFRLRQGSSLEDRLER